MFHWSSIVAGSALVVCLSPLAAATAAARLPDERTTPNAVVPRDPPVREYSPSSTSTAVAASDDAAMTALLATGSALAGAGLALGGSHLYRRQQRRAT